MSKRYRSYTFEEYLRAMNLLNQGLGPTEVCRILGWPITRKSTVSGWKNGKHRPPTVRWVPEPSKKLAYVLGVLLGDGYTVKEHTYHYDIEILVKDYEFAEIFSRNMSKLLNKKYIEPEWSRGHSRWRVYYSSKAFHIWFKKQTLETLKQYIEYNKETVVSFLKGLYDSEGSNYMCKKISLFNSDLELLYYVQYLLRKYFSIKATGPYLKVKAGSIMKRNGRRYKRRKNNYSIAISRKDSIRMFLSKIGFSITEKQLGLRRRKRQ